MKEEKRIRLKTPLTDSDITKLKSGDSVLITGILYTARDQAHKRMFETLNRNEKLPFDIRGQIIYFAGPTPTREGFVTGSIGPTTSYRMDAYSPKLIENGLKGMIGKGTRSKEVIEVIKKYKCLYFGATGGAGALIARSVKKVETIAYEDLGPEAIRRIEVENFPAIVINDIYGNDLYEIGVREYKL